VLAGIAFAILLSMKQLLRLYAVAGTVIAVACLTVTLATAVNAQKKVVDQIAKTEQPEISPAEKQIIKAFDERVKQYMKVRASVKEKAPKLAKESTPEQIQANEKAFIEALRAARTGARPGDLFTKDIAQYIRTTLKTEFTSTDKKEVKEVVLEKETNIPVPLKVNYPYPDPKEFVEMPATLLLKLPPVPKELKYRYVGHTLMLLDNDSSLIIDYMVKALP
jgi:ABC-type transporter MlaC component